MKENVKLNARHYFWRKQYRKGYYKKAMDSIDERIKKLLKRKEELMQRNDYCKEYYKGEFAQPEDINRAEQGEGSPQEIVHIPSPEI